MALETLKGVKEIGGFEVADKLFTELQIATMHFPPAIFINHRANTITFKLQNGPIKEVGVNGCQVDTIIEAAKLIIEGLNEKYPCDENRDVIHFLHRALGSLAHRTADREERGVEGTSQA